MTRLFFIALLLATIQGFGQTFLEFSVAERMPSAETYVAFQDSRGYMWFGTDNGVARFDGKQMEVFHVKDGLVDPVVFGITEDYKGRLWFRSYSGKICYFENGRFFPYRYNEALTNIAKNMLINSLVCDSLDRVWFGSGPMIGYVDEKGTVHSDTIDEYHVEVREIEKQPVLAFYGPTHRINKFVYGKQTFPLNNNDTLYRYHVLCAVRWKNKLYLSNSNNVFEFDGKKVSRVLVSKAAVISMSKDNEDNLWIGYLNNGVERYSSNFDKPDLSLFHEKSITSTLQDHEGGIWLTTLENGALYIPNLQISNYTPALFDKVRAPLTFDNKITWGDINGRLISVDPITKKVAWEKNLEHPIVSIFQSKNGNLWVSTTRRIYIYNNKMQLLRSLPFSKQFILEKEDGSIVTLTSVVMQQFDSTGAATERKILKKIYRSILASGDKYILAGRSGLEIASKDFDVTYEFPQFENMKVSKLLNLTDSTFLAATVGNGFFIINLNSLKTQQFNSQNNFVADNINTVLNLDGVLWMGTEKGLVKISLNDLNNGRYNFEFLSHKAGLLHNKINHLAGNDHVIWVFGDQGITTIPTANTPFANKAPKFILNSIKVNSVEVANTSALTLPYNKNDLQFEYRCITFNNPDVLLRSRLSKQEPWTLSENLKLFFPSLAPGVYNLEIQYSVDNIHWIDATTPFEFTVEQAWYRKWYFLLAVLLAATILGFLYIRYLRAIYKRTNHYLKIINEHQQKLIQSEIVTLERERNRIAKELHDRVGTNLTAIKLTVSQILSAHRDPYAGEVEEQFQVAIKEIKDIIYALAPPSLERYGLFTSLKNYVGKLSKNIPINFSLKTFGNEIKDSDLNIILFRVIQELLTNSIKHSSAKNITIHINSFDDVLNIMYEDDGVGFLYDPLQSGIGLDNIESRIRSVHGTLKFDSGKFGISYNIDIPIKANKEVA